MISKKNMFNFEKVAKSLSTYFGLVLAIVGVAVALLNVWVISKLAPIDQNMAVLVERVNANDGQHKDLVNKGEFEQVVTRINYISGRVDQIFSILSRK